MLQLSKKLVTLYSLISLILLLGLNADAQVSCVGDKVVCDNGGIPYCYHLFNEISSRPICSVDYNVPPGGKYGPACTHPRDGIKPTKPECLLSAPPLPLGVEFYCDDNGKIICGNGGTPSCASRGPNYYPSCKLGGICCTLSGVCVGGLQCLKLCDAGYTICPGANNPISCCLYGCCPLDPTKCKCKDSDRCSPNCTDTSTPTYSCDSGLTICPNNTDPNGKCCKYGCCPSDPTKCKCQFSGNCSPNCLRCDADDIACPNSDNPKACCKHGCCPSDLTKCKCPDSNQCSPNCTQKYTCDSGLIICPNDTTPTALCCPYGCCPTDATKCKCQLNNQCEPNCNSSSESCESLGCTSNAQCSKCSSKMVPVSGKSGKFKYYACQNFIKKGKHVCDHKMLNTKKLEDFFIEVIKEKLITDENLTEVANALIDELNVLKAERGKTLPQIQKRIDDIDKRLERLYESIESGKLDFGDLAGRIKRLNGDKAALLAEHKEIEEQIGNWVEAPLLSKDDVGFYVNDLKETLAEGSIIEQKKFIRSFIKRIDLNHPKVEVEYTVPLIQQKKRVTSKTEVLSLVENGSPRDPIGRTFKYRFSLPNFSDLTKPKLQKIYKNPIYTALEWQEMLDSGKFKSKAELGRHFGVSRVRVVQILNLLKLDPEVINKLKEVGETLNKKMWGEKTLRQIVNADPNKQLEKITSVLNKSIVNTL